MIWIEDKTYLNEEVKLDFTRWKKCAFLKCKIIIKYGEFDLVDCKFNDCKFIVDGVAGTIIKFFRDAYPTIPVGEDVKDPVWLFKALNWLNEKNPEGVKDWVYDVLLKVEGIEKEVST